jgi:tryptophanyl-tRNA synthetase
VAALKPIREKILETMKDKSSLDKIFQKGAERARSRARETLTEVYDAVGFVPGRYQVKLDG